MNWDEKYGWAPPIAEFTDLEGRKIALKHFSIEITHAGVLDGRPSVGSTRKRFANQPLFSEQPVLILPREAIPSHSLVLSEMYLLPKYFMHLHLESEPIEADDGDFSVLRVIYFTDHAEDFVIATAISRILPKLDWYTNAIDRSL